MVFHWLSQRLQRQSQRSRQRSRTNKRSGATLRPRVEEFEPRLVLANHLFSVPGADQTSLTFTWTIRDAAFNNEIGVYAVQDDAGRLNGLSPSDVGYAQAALQSAQVVFSSGQGAGAHRDLTFTGGAQLAFL